MRAEKKTELMSPGPLWYSKKMRIVQSQLTLASDRRVNWYFFFPPFQEKPFHKSEKNNRSVLIAKAIFEHTAIALPVWRNGPNTFVHLSGGSIDTHNYKRKRSMRYKDLIDDERCLSDSRAGDGPLLRFYSICGHFLFSLFVAVTEF